MAHGKVYVGQGTEGCKQASSSESLCGMVAAGKECWWFPPGTSGCEEYYEKTHPDLNPGLAEGSSQEGAKQHPLHFT
jgi:hypothetical protein